MISSSHNWMKQCNYTKFLQEQNWYLNKFVAELAALRKEEIENKIPIFVTNTVCDYNLLKNYLP